VLSEETVHELLYFVGLEWNESDRELLDPIVDAAFVCAEDDVPTATLDPIVETLWREGLATDIERALDDASVRHNVVARARESARADLATGPKLSALGRAIVLQGAADLAFRESESIFCMLCLEEMALTAAPEPRRALARRIARLATRVAAVPRAEVRSALARSAVAPPCTAVRLATDERRLAVRAWLGRLASLGRRSVPTLASELRAELHGPLPPSSADPLWRETVYALVEALEPARN
jgi:hypothetical protein